MWKRALVAAAIASLLSASPAAADWRGDTKVLRLAFLTPSDPAAGVAQLEPFRTYLEARIGLPVELIPATTASALIEAETSGRVQYAILSASAYATADALCSCVEPLVLPAAFDGSRGFHAILLARADSTIHTLAETEGARLALGAADSITGRLLPMQAFADAAIDPAKQFTAIYESPGPADAVAALLDGRADIAAAWSSLTGDGTSGYSFGVLTDMVKAGRLAMDQVRVIWQSPLIPFGPHVVRRDMPAELKGLLRDALLGLASADPDALDAVDRSSLGGGGFIAATVGDYAVIDNLVAGAATTDR